jgi:ATP-dependent RNA helicase RhlE
MNFDQLGLIEPILRALQEEGYATPTPIQQQAIPPLLEGKDLLGCAQTGTGKTAAFAIPLLQLLYAKKAAPSRGKHIKALVLTPTRELAIQIDDSFKAYGRHCGLKHTVIFGGVSQHAQTSKLNSGIDVLTATPGRLLDLIQQGFIDLSKLEFFVLDEADRMLDMGFIHDVRRVITLLPEKRQSLFFSATMPPEIVKLADKILKSPVKVSVTPPATTAEKIAQTIYYVGKDEKRSLLIKILEDENIERVLLFTRTKHGANRVAKDLVKQEISAEAIHGNKSQVARQTALKNFKEKKTRVLVATDIAARGIDVDDLTHVINFEIPNVPETYVHRIGRTGRAGASGIAISFCDEEEQEYIRDIQKLIGLQIPLAEGSEAPRSVGAASRSPQPAKARSGQGGRTGQGGRSGQSGQNGQRGRTGQGERSSQGDGSQSASHGPRSRDQKQGSERQGQRSANGSTARGEGGERKGAGANTSRKRSGTHANGQNERSAEGAPSTPGAGDRKQGQQRSQGSRPPRQRDGQQRDRRPQRNQETSAKPPLSVSPGATEDEKKDSWLKRFFKKR